MIEETRPFTRRAVAIFACQIGTITPSTSAVVMSLTGLRPTLTLDGDDECGSEHGDADIRQDNNSMDEEDSEGWIRCMSIPSRMG